MRILSSLAVSLLLVLFVVSVVGTSACASGRIVRVGKQLEDIAMPLGAIGGGHVSICGDGAIRQWNIFNNANPGFVVPDSFFAIWAKRIGREPVAKLLQQTPIEKLPVVKSVEFIGEYPVAELSFADDDLPVEVKLTAFSPHIPLNARDSAIPAVIYEFKVRNKTASEVSVSLLATFQNAVGSNGKEPMAGVLSKFYGDNLNKAIHRKGYVGALLTNPSLKPDAKHPGTMLVATLCENADVTAQWDNLPALWNTFSRLGRLDGIEKQGPSAAGRTWNAAVTVPMTLKPAETRTVTYLWCWHFPKRYVFWDDRASNIDIGVMYANWFADAGEVADYVVSNYTRLAGDTKKFRDTFYKTSLPYWLLDRISAQSSTLVSTVCMWLRDGTFAAFEGGPACCPLNCTHVWNYEQQMAYLFPELDRAMRKTDFEVQQQEDGGIRHRTRLPLSEPREHIPFCDGHLGTILKAYREHRQSADRGFLDRYWPNIKRAMTYVLDNWDRNKDGVIVGSQWNTYDTTMYGPNTFIGTLYLAALRACQEMAITKGELEFANTLRQVFDSGSKRLDEACWNGEYWWHIESKPTAADLGADHWLLEDWPEIKPDDPHNRPYGKGCHIDQLLGQWWANQLGLGYLLPPDRVRTALDSIMKYNWVADFGKVRQHQRAFAGDGDPGMYNCTWPKGEQPLNEMLYSMEVWTGLEYELAGLLIHEGKCEEGYRVVKAVSDRYDGRKRPPIQRNPWAEVECGNHYARAMSSWGILLAAQGYTYCGPEKRIGFDPKVTPENHTSFFTGAEGWGLFTQKRSGSSQVNEIVVEYGTLQIKDLTLHLPPQAIAAIESKSLSTTVDKRFGAFTTSRCGKNGVTISFDEAVTVKSGQRLAIRFKW